MSKFSLFLVFTIGVFDEQARTERKAEKGNWRSGWSKLYCPTKRIKKQLGFKANITNRQTHERTKAKLAKPNSPTSPPGEKDWLTRVLKPETREGIRACPAKKTLFDDQREELVFGE